MRAAKRAARSELSVSKGEWQRNGYAQPDLLSTAGVVDQVERVHCSVRRPCKAAQLPCRRTLCLQTST